MKDVTNCRNCGAPLNEDGTCLHCGTRHRRVNFLNCGDGITDIELTFKMDNEIHIIPLRGRITEIEVKPCDIDVSFVDPRIYRRYRESTTVIFEFQGELLDERD